MRQRHVAECQRDPRRAVAATGSIVLVGAAVRPVGKRDRAAAPSSNPHTSKVKASLAFKDTRNKMRGDFRCVKFNFKGLKTPADGAGSRGTTQVYSSAIPIPFRLRTTQLLV